MNGFPSCRNPEYQPEFKSKDGAQTKIFDALEWLAAMPLPVRAARRQVQSRAQ